MTHDAPRTSETGSSLIAVIGIAFVLLILVTTVLTSAFNGFRQANDSEDFHASLAAAEAGISDYLYRLNQDGNYWQYDGDPLSPAPDPPDANPAFADFTNLPSSALGGQFTYRADASNIASQGLVDLSVTGQVGDSQRRIDVTLRRRSFLDYLYFTDYETRDPARYPFDLNNDGDSNDVFRFDNNGDGVADDALAERGWAQTNCAVHDWEVAGGRPLGCTDIFFYGGGGTARDVIAGPLHTNDTMIISGNPRFEGETTSSYALPDDDDPTVDCVGDRWNGSGSPEFVVSCTPDAPARTGPAYSQQLTLPPNNDAIRDEADADLGTVGCLFTGPTKIELVGGNRMDVSSPMSNVRLGDSNYCPEGVQDIPPNGVIYVQDVPADPADDNFVAGCADRDGTPFRPAGWHPAHPFARDMGNDAYWFVVDPDDEPRDCRVGDAFVWGTTGDQVTIAAENDIWIVDDLTVESAAGDGIPGPDNDVIGLIADNFVQIYKPYGCTNLSSGVYSQENRRQRFRDGEFAGRRDWYNFLCLNDGGGNNIEGNVPVLFSQPGLDVAADHPNVAPESQRFHDPTIHAAMLSVRHSFIVYASNRGGVEGTLNVRGAIGQRYRGPVGTFNPSNGNTTNGYLKGYVYDERLQYLQPPHFIDPVEAAWQVNTWAEGVPTAAAP